MITTQDWLYRNSPEWQMAFDIGYECAKEQILKELKSQIEKISKMSNWSTETFTMTFEKGDKR